MKINIPLKKICVRNGKNFDLSKHSTKVDKYYKDKAHYNSLIDQFRTEIDELQQMMYAQDRQGLLIIFQAMDAAGKDSTIKHVMSGVNPQGVEVHAFERPTQHELDHDYLWRCSRVLPPRGRIGIFNRSYYEEILVCRVHPEIVKEIQRIPEESTQNLKKLYEKRSEEIINFEKYCHHNGIKIIKFFLNVSKTEQKKRLLARIDTPSKNWKFDQQDVKERAYWVDYMKAYQKAIESTGTEYSPWYIIPADDKKNMRLMVSSAILEELHLMKLSYPKIGPDQLAILEKSKELLLAEKDE
jgi:PPK2 family polyphosphate:nucleotide phosphotransferase